MANVSAQAAARGDAHVRAAVGREILQFSEIVGIRIFGGCALEDAVHRPRETLPMAWTASCRSRPSAIRRTNVSWTGSDAPSAIWFSTPHRAAAGAALLLSSTLKGSHSTARRVTPGPRSSSPLPRPCRGRTRFSRGKDWHPFRVHRAWAQTRFQGFHPWLTNGSPSGCRNPSAAPVANT